MFNKVSVNSNEGFGSDKNKKIIFGKLCSKDYGGKGL
jgi:hypothetical protein